MNPQDAIAEPKVFICQCGEVLTKNLFVGSKHLKATCPGCDQNWALPGDYFGDHKTRYYTSEGLVQ